MTFKKRPKKVYVIVTVIALLLTSAYVFYRVKKHAFLDHKLQQIVKDKTHQLYNITYDSISVNEVGGDLYIKNIYIKGDTLLQQQMINNNDTNATSAIFDIYVPMLKVVNFKTAKALLSKQMECKEVIILNPLVHIYLFPGQGKQTDAKKKQEELYKQILGNFKLIKVDSVSIQNGEVIASDFFTKEIKFRTLQTSVNLTGVAIDSTYNQDRTRTLFCKQIGVTSEKIILGDKKNTSEISNATFNTQSKILAFASLSHDAFKNNGFFKTEFQGISLQGIEWLGPVENSDLIIDKVVINKGELETLLDDEKENKGKQKKDSKILTGWIRNFSLNSLQVKSVTYISKTSDPKKKPFIVRNNSFSIRNIMIDRASAFNGKLINQAKEIELHNDAISLRSSDNMYEYKVAGIKLNTKTKSIAITSIRMIPQLNESAFARKAHYQTDRYDITIRNLKCNNVNAEKLVKGEIDIETINTSGNTINVFRDLSFPLDSVSRQGQQLTYPHQLIHKLGIPIKIGRFTFTNTDIEYKEKNPLSANSGKVRFSNTYLTINNITTHKAREGERMTVTFKSSFLDKIPVTGGFTFSLKEWEKGTFTAEAIVNDRIEGTMLNQLTEPMGLIKVEKGEINSVHFNMKADTNTANGTLTMPYQDLKISLLKKKGDQYSKKGIFSLLANLALKNKNKEGENMRTAKVVLTRNKYRTFFNFIWMTIFKGIRDIGVIKI
ncbi:MAG: hypothetical protein JWR18_948 [Segetibacter sp.]|nr:hypothetical protein [Segetibacter sp.]